MKALLSYCIFLFCLQNLNANVLIKQFEVSINAQSAIISWAIDIAPYTVTANLEKSKDGIIYYTISTFELSTERHNGSSYADKNLTPGTYYYRLHLSKPGYLPLISKVNTVKIDFSVNDKDFHVTNPVNESFRIYGKFTGKTIVIELIGLNGTATINAEIRPVNHAFATFPSLSVRKGSYVLKVREKGNSIPFIIRTVYKN